MSAVDIHRGPPPTGRWSERSPKSARYLLALSALSFLIYLTQSSVIRAFFADLPALLRQVTGG